MLLPAQWGSEVLMERSWGDGLCDAPPGSNLLPEASVPGHGHVLGLGSSDLQPGSAWLCLHFDLCCFVSQDLDFFFPCYISSSYCQIASLGGGGGIDSGSPID